MKLLCGSKLGLLDESPVLLIAKPSFQLSFLILGPRIQLSQEIDRVCLLFGQLAKFSLYRSF